MKRSLRRTKKQIPAKGDLLWRKMRPSGRFILLLTAGDAEARRQFRRNLVFHKATELLIYRNKSGEIVNIDFRQIRYRGTFTGFIARAVFAHVGKSATGARRHQASGSIKGAA